MHSVYSLPRRFKRILCSCGEAACFTVRDAWEFDEFGKDGEFSVRGGQSCVCGDDGDLEAWYIGRADGD